MAAFAGSWLPGFDRSWYAAWQYCQLLPTAYQGRLSRLGSKP